MPATEIGGTGFESGAVRATQNALNKLWTRQDKMRGRFAFGATGIAFGCNWFRLRTSLVLIGGGGWMTFLRLSHQMIGKRTTPFWGCKLEA